MLAYAMLAERSSRVEHATRVLFPATRRKHGVGVGGNTQGFQICASSNLRAAQEHTIIGCLRRVAADSTRVACSTRNLPLAAATILVREPWSR